MNSFFQRLASTGYRRLSPVKYFFQRLFGGPTSGNTIALEDPAIKVRSLFAEYDRLARAQGFDRLYFLLSFDCDTPEDITAAEKLAGWLTARSIPVTFAVPGCILRQGAEVFRRIADRGVEFINHGASPHTEWRDGRYWSVNFYHLMPPEQVRKDIQDGHTIMQDVLGRIPAGFRAPHFGTFQQTEQREIIYEELRALHYGYSTSTMPEYAMKRGPIWDAGGLFEIPLLGSSQMPYNVFDSWGQVESPYRPVIKEIYADLFIQTVEQLLQWKVAGVVNYYVDPAHVQSSGAFYRAMQYLLEKKVPAIQFESLLNLHKNP